MIPASAFPILAHHFIEVFFPVVDVEFFTGFDALAVVGFIDVESEGGG